jgi:hypothetical protein
MANQVNYLKAKRRILECFRPECDPVQAASAIGDEEFVSLLDAVRTTIPWKKPTQAGTLEMFLYAGAKRFDRWSIPTPYVVPPTHHERFSKFVAALRQAEKDKPTNCPVFELHSIRDDVFMHFDKVPVDTVRATELGGFRKRIESIPTPSFPPKRIEFENQRSELLAVLAGLENGSLRTRLCFRVPYALHHRLLHVDFVWNAVTMRAEIESTFSMSEESFIQAGNGGTLTAGASRWQAGTSVVSLELSALLDGSTYTECLQAIPGVDLPQKGWPQSFTWAFSIFHDLAWTLRASHGGRQDWIPAPRDLSDLELEINTSDVSKIGWIRKGSPAALQSIFTPSSAPVTISLGALQRLPWSSECRTRANMYLELGDTNEALFWTNVATESLITQRFEEIEATTGRSGLTASLKSPKEFWAEAEIILVKQFPDMKGKVKWPSSAIHVSVYGKLKTLYRLVPMKTTLDELLTKYRVISGQRNDLFHGKSTDRVSVSSVQAASEALSWIEQNMWPVSVPDAVA